MTTRRIYVLLFCSGLAACGGQTATHSTPSQSALRTPVRGSAAYAELTTSSAPTVTALTSAPAASPADGLGPFTCGLPISRAASGTGLPPGSLAQPTTARVAGQSGYDRIVFEYSGTALPSLSVTSVTPPFTTDPWRYRDYIQPSRGEFTVARDVHVRLRSGWFSERSACYLAAGRPVITQDTGFGTVLPTGEGLFAFNSMDEILAAFEAVNADYEKHSRAARAVAEDYFKAEKVLAKLLNDLGL